MLSLLFVIILFIVIFSFLVLVHEWGHYITAVKCGVRVDEFGLGMPPKAATIAKRGPTAFTLNWIPFGGFVRMHGQSDFDPASDHNHDKDPTSFRNKTYLQKVLIISGGVIMNFLAAYVLLIIVFIVGFRPLMVIPDHLIGGTVASYVTPTASYLTQRPDIFQFEEIAAGNPTFITGVTENSIAAEAGLQTGDRIVSIDGMTIESQDTVKEYLDTNKGGTMVFTVERVNENQDRVLTLDITVPTETDTLIGIGFGQVPELAMIRFHPMEAPIKAGQELGTQMLVTLTLAKNVFGGMISNGEVSKNISGPIGIASATGTVAERGFIALVLLTIILSINLGIMNILPIPALDGGHLLTITCTTLYRKITKKSPHPSIEASIQGIGMILLMGLILIVTWNDIMRLIG